MLFVIEIFSRAKKVKQSSLLFLERALLSIKVNLFKNVQERKWQWKLIIRFIYFQNNENVCSIVHLKYSNPLFTGNIYIRNGSMAEHRSHMCQLGLCQYRNRVVETHCSRILSMQCLHLWATCRDKKVKRGNQFQGMEHLLQMCMALSFWDSSRYGISINTVQDFPVTSR